MTNPFATTTLLGLLLFGMITVAAWAPRTPSLSRLCSDEVATRRRAGTSPRSPQRSRPGAPLMSGDAASARNSSGAEQLYGLTDKARSATPAVILRRCRPRHSITIFGAARPAPPPLS